MQKLIKRLSKPCTRRAEKGFTLIELLIVVAIIGILAAVVIPNLLTFLSTARLSAARSEAENVKTAALAYFADNSFWPNTSANLSAANNPGGQNYLSTSTALKGTYTFSASFPALPETGDGTVTGGTYSTFHWNAGTQTWDK